jgi:hypothetical protein
MRIAVGSRGGSSTDASHGLLPLVFLARLLVSVIVACGVVLG